MTETPIATETAPFAPDDPRIGLARTTSAVRSLMESVTAQQLTKQTPCADFLVKDLLDHLVMVMCRIAVVGNGQDWAEVTEESARMESGHAEAFAAAAHDVMEAWTDSAKLEAMFDLPFGTLPGAPVLLTYTGELAVHGWDLATAIGSDFSIDDEFLGGALFAAKMLPEEGRDDPEMPFDPVVDPGPDASILLQIAGWFGRQV